MTTRWLWRVGILVLVAAAFVAGALVGHESVDQSAEPSPGTSSVDAGFARDMAVHHEQAVEMAILVRDRGSDPEVRSIARDIQLTQQYQIGQMHEWLDSWGLSYVAQQRMAWMPGHEHDAMAMPGMASREELRGLGSARERQADIRFLRLMMAHHRGGIEMAEAAAEHASLGRVREVSRKMASTQRAENRSMSDLLDRLTND